MMNLKHIFIGIFIVFVVHTTKSNVQAGVVKKVLQQIGIQSKSSKLLTQEEGCGISYMKPVSKTRIFKGTDAQPGQFPWMAILLYKGSDNKMKNTLCGGTLITSRHVLTAGVCADEKPFAVRLGEYDRTDTKDGQHQDINVKKIILHEDYVLIRLNPGRYPINDIALLKLESNVDFSSVFGNIRPICLPLNDEIRNRNFVGSIGTVAGWGELKINGTEPKILQQKKISVLDGSECSKKYESKFFPHTELCGMSLDNHTATCRGDAGGPLMLPINGSIYQIGIISYGPPCDGRIFPEVLTSISYYMNWIKSHLEL